MDPKKVREARLKEVDTINEVGVWEVIRRRDMPKGMRTISGRWVDTSKGDNTNPNYRSRYIGREIK